MRVLGHIHTYNEGRVIDRSVAAVLEQTYPVEELLLIDNASTDDTLERCFPPKVTVERFERNSLTSDPIIRAMAYAIEHDYDWVWLLNGDTAPRPDCLAGMLELYLDLDEETRDRTWLLSALPVNQASDHAEDGYLVTPEGLKRVKPSEGQTRYECEAVIWSGSMYKVSAIREVGFPRSDYAMDIAEIEFGYRGKCRGYRAFMCRSCIADHNLDGPSVTGTRYGFGPLSITLPELKPFRCYYVVRNMLHFWLYVFRERGLSTYLYCVAKVALFISAFALRPVSHRHQLIACAAGVRDGLLKRLDYRYPV